MYAIGGAFALVVAAGVYSLDSFFARSWFDSSVVQPHAYTPLTLACLIGAVVFLLAAPLCLRWPRLAAALSALGWLAGMAAPLLLPWWQRAHEVETFGGWNIFAAVWLVVLLPLGAASVHGVVLDRRPASGASA